MQKLLLVYTDCFFYFVLETALIYYSFCSINLMELYRYIKQHTDTLNLLQIYVHTRNRTNDFHAPFFVICIFFTSHNNKNLNLVPLPTQHHSLLSAPSSLHFNC